jgi:hypothetical protein
MQTPINPVRIYVSRAGNSTRLRLRDNRNNPNPIDFSLESNSQGEFKSPEIDTDVDKGSLIIWELDPRSLSNPPEHGYFPIKSIDNIVQTFEVDNPKYKGSEAVLTGDPVNAGNSFVATVPNPSAGKGKFANYRIEYTLPDDTKHVQDPKIQLNS